MFIKAISHDTFLCIPEHNLGSYSLDGCKCEFVASHYNYSLWFDNVCKEFDDVMPQTCIYSYLSTFNASECLLKYKLELSATGC
jgi:hypothetical protein